MFKDEEGNEDEQLVDDDMINDLSLSKLEINDKLIVADPDFEEVPDINELEIDENPEPQRMSYQNWK